MPAATATAMISRPLPISLGRSRSNIPSTWYSRTDSRRLPASPTAGAPTSGTATYMRSRRTVRL